MLNVMFENSECQLRIIGTVENEKSALKEKKYEEL